MPAKHVARTALTLAFMAMATVVLPTGAFADITIFSDDFSGDGSPLNGTTPNVGPYSGIPVGTEWYAGETTFFNDGSVDATPNDPGVFPRGGGGAYLPFEPDAGRVYTLSADINNLTAGWVGFGFVERPFNNFIDDDSGRQEQAAFGTQWFQMFSTSARFMSGKSTALPTDDPPGTRIATVAGLGGTNSLEIILDTNDSGNVMVSASINATPVDLDPNSAATDYNAGPLATMGTGGDGIQGLGFSVSGTTSATVLDGIDNLLLISDAEPPPLLTLEVNTDTGATTLVGHPTEAVDFNFYEIASPNNALDHENWLSLADQDFDGNGPPSGQGDGWEESGGVGPHALAEGYLLGNSTINASTSVSLGMGYNVDVGDTNLTFKFRNADGLIVEGLVDYVDEPSVTGDFTGPAGVPDGVWDCDDINALVAEIVAGDDNAAFDMNGDGMVDLDDITDEDAGWLAVGGANNADDTGGNPFLEGDANLDGVVDVSDFNEWNGSKFTSVAAWCSGDFNADGSVDVSDFNIWNGNKFSSSSGVAVVPEPSSMLLLAAGMAALGMWRKRRAG